MPGENFNNWKTEVDGWESIEGSSLEQLWGRLDNRLQARHKNGHQHPMGLISAAACIVLLFGIFYFGLGGGEKGKQVTHKDVVPFARQNHSNSLPAGTVQESKVVTVPVTVSRVAPIKRERQKLLVAQDGHMDSNNIPHAERVVVSQEDLVSPPVAQADVSFPALKKKMPVVHVNELESRVLPAESATSSGRTQKAKWLRKTSELNQAEPQSSLSIKIPL